MNEQSYPKWLDDDYIDLSKILSYNAIINFLDTPRNRGKSWSIQIRAFKHALRHGRTTILCRRNKKSAQKAMQKAFSPKLCAFLGIDPQAIARNGNVISYEKRKGLLIPMIEVCALSDRYNQRSADSGLADLFVVDEANVPPEERSFFRGDPVENMLDIWDSNRREASMPLLIFGNREGVVNPFQSYFGIKPLPIDFNGIRRYRQKTILVAQSTKEGKREGDFNDKVRVALKGTRYDRFARAGMPKGTDLSHVINRPANATWYMTVIFKSKHYAFYRFDGGLWITTEQDRSRKAFALGDKPVDGAEWIQSFSKNKQRFSFLFKSLRDNALWFSNPDIPEELSEVLFK